MLAVANFSNPIFWAVLIGWILTVVLHEFAHGLVADLGGDYTIRYRGGLSLNPLQYIHPITSIVMPAIFLMMGGIPLPGGATYIRRDLLRSKYWQSAVSLAGPAMNFVIFLALSLPFHPLIGWIKLDPSQEKWTNLQLFMGSLAFLQLYCVLLNLLPIPGIDGFGVIEPFLPRDIRRMLQGPQVFLAGIVIVFILLWNPTAQRFLFHAMSGCMSHLRFDEDTQDFFGNSFYRVFFG
jgi:Zn-dependent protease